MHLPNLDPQCGLSGTNGITNYESLNANYEFLNTSFGLPLGAFFPAKAN